MSNTVKNAKRKYKKKGTSWYNKKYSAFQLAERAVKEIHYLKGLINSEKKFNTLAVTGTVPFTGTVAHLSIISQGAANDQRNGLSVLCRSIYIRGSVENQHTTATSSRFIVFIDKNDSDGTIPSNINLLLQASSVGTTQAPNSMLNRDNLGRFKILSSKMINTSPTDLARNFKFFIPLRHHIRWDTAGSTSKGHIYFAIVSNQSAPNAPVITYTTRISYYDN